MNATHSSDVVVIGASIGGLAAAAYLARAGLSVTVFEASLRTGGLTAAHTLYALDPMVVRDLKLARHGLRFDVRDRALVGLRPDGHHVVLTRDVHGTARALGAISRADAEAWPGWRHALQSLGRAMRGLWWREPNAGLHARLMERVAVLRRQGADSWLDACFESDALKATLAFDAVSGGLSTLEPGSALTLVWRMAQEMSGLQGAVAWPYDGLAGLVAALGNAARAAGAEIRTSSAVRKILVEAGRVVGVELTSGHAVAASHVLSGLSRRRTLCDLLADGDSGLDAVAHCERMRPAVGAAHLVLTLEALPHFAGVPVPRAGRFVAAEGLESYAAAHAAARAGRLPHDLPMEITLPTAGEPWLEPGAHHRLSAVIRPVPVAPAEGWQILKPKLLERAILALSAQSPGLVPKIVSADLHTPADFLEQCGHEDASSNATHMLASWCTRIATPIAGLLLCGAAAEPVPSVSGRAGRIAAAMIVKEAER